MMEKRPGRRRRKQGCSNAVYGDEKEPHLNQIGKLCEKIMAYSTRARYSMYILPVTIILIIPIGCGRNTSLR